MALLQAAQVPARTTVSSRLRAFVSPIGGAGLSVAVASALVLGPASSLGGPAVLGGAAVLAATSPSLTASPNSGVVGSHIQVKGAGLPKSHRLQIIWDDSSTGMPAPLWTSSTGSLTTTVTIPAKAAGKHTIAIRWITDPRHLAGTTFTITSSTTPPPTVAPSTGPTPKPTVVPTPAPTSTPTPPPSGSFIFSDEFNGASVDSSKWRVSNYGVTGGGRRCCGDTSITANYASQVSESGGYLHLRADLVSGKWHMGTLDTETHWLSHYGKWEARIRVPLGYGMWPAFWGYTGNGQEIDVLESCDGAAGTHGGNDVTLAHQSVHYDNSSPRIARDSRHGDLSLGFHTYGVDWRAGKIQFYFDGAPMGSAVTSNVPSSSMPLILNLGVGGTWCGNPNSTTPAHNEMLVDWIHVSP
jgi:beta-glucanase (GH16 family)